MKKSHTMHDAKSQLSRLVERATAGEDIVIARGRVPVVRLVPVLAPRVERRFGAMRGRAKVGRAFFTPLPPGELTP